MEQDLIPHEENCDFRPISCFGPAARPGFICAQKFPYVNFFDHLKQNHDFQDFGETKNLKLKTHLVIDSC